MGAELVISLHKSGARPGEVSMPFSSCSRSSPRALPSLRALLAVAALLLAAPRAALGDEALPAGDAHLDGYAAWWTGSLLASPGHTLPAGRVMLEPYLMYAEPLAQKPQRSLALLVVAQAGLTRALDLQLAVEGAYRARSGVSSTQLGGVSGRLAFQVLEDHPEDWTPALLFFAQESFPTGRYMHLDPALNGTDASGGGTFTTTLGLSAQKVFWPSLRLPLRLRLNLSGQAPTAVTVEGPSVYGGSADTQGTVFPGKGLRALVAGELHLTPHWVAALDFGYAHAGPDVCVTRPISISIPVAPVARGIPVARVARIAAPVGGPARDTVTIAPAVAYTFTESIGLIGGVSFDVGRNVPAAVRPMVALMTVY
jgi:hypothetical protein